MEECDVETCLGQALCMLQSTGTSVMYILGAAFEPKSQFDKRKINGHFVSFMWTFYTNFF